MAGRSREREAAFTSGQAVERRRLSDLATDQGFPKRDGRGARAPHADEGQYHEEVKAQEGQVEAEGHNLLCPEGSADFHEDENPEVDNWRDSAPS